MSVTLSPLKKVFIPRDQLPLRRVSVLGIPVAVITRDELTHLLEQTLQQGVRGWFSYVNIHAVNLSLQIPWFQDFLQKSLVAYCDGDGVRLGARILGQRIPERIVMTDWLYDVCALAESTGRSLYFFGSTKAVLSQAVLNIRSRFPGLRIGGYHNGYVDSSEISGVLREINESRSDILVVGMGMPLQERWILDNYDRLNTKVILNAGSCLEYVAGAKKRCPVLMGRIGLEWMYRLMQEPRRLWKRYLIGNPQFVMRCIAEALKATSTRRN